MNQSERCIYDGERTYLWSYRGDTSWYLLCTTTFSSRALTKNVVQMPDNLGSGFLNGLAVGLDDDTADPSHKRTGGALLLVDYGWIGIPPRNAARNLITQATGADLRNLLDR